VLGKALGRDLLELFLQPSLLHGALSRVRSGFL
jgi:hypothetical protein